MVDQGDMLEEDDATVITRTYANMETKLACGVFSTREKIARLPATFDYWMRQTARNHPDALERAT